MAAPGARFCGRDVFGGTDRSVLGIRNLRVMKIPGNYLQCWAYPEKIEVLPQMFFNSVIKLFEFYGAVENYFEVQ